MAIYRRERSTRLLVIGLVVASLLTITVDFRAGESGPLAAIGRFSLAVVSPIQNAIASVFRPIGNFFGDLGRLGSLKAENDRLKAALEESRGERSQYLAALAEAEELRGLLDLRDELGFRTVGAEVVSEIPSNFEASVTIDAGSVDGLELDMPVIAADGLVGRVVRVADNWSKVLLIIDPNSAVGVRLASTREVGLLVGQRDRDLRMTLVDPETPVKPSEPVATSGLGGVFPPGIPVGEVSQVVPEEGALEKEILVRPNVDFSRLATVLVVLSPEITVAPQQ